MALLPDLIRPEVWGVSFAAFSIHVSSPTMYSQMPRVPMAKSLNAVNWSHLMNLNLNLIIPAVKLCWSIHTKAKAETGATSSWRHILIFEKAPKWEETITNITKTAYLIVQCFTIHCSELAMSRAVPSSACHRCSYRCSFLQRQQQPARYLLVCLNTVSALTALPYPIIILVTELPKYTL